MIRVNRITRPTIRGVPHGRQRHRRRKTHDQDDEPIARHEPGGGQEDDRRGARAGYITYDQLNQVLPPDQVSSEQIEDVMSMLSEMGINIIEDEEAEDDDEQGLDRVVATASTSREVAVAGDRDREARPHRRPGADVSARNGLGRAAVAARARSPSPSGSRPAATR